MNYVLFCHQRGLPSEQTPEETGVCRSKRSCLKANRRGSPEEKARETSNTSPVAGEVEALGKAEEANREMIDGAQIKPALCCKESKALVDGIKSRHRATRLARVQDSLAQRTQHIPTAYSHDSSSGCKFSQPLPTPWGYSGSSLHRWQKELSIESPQVLTYHEIPLLTLDWNANKAHQWGTAEMDDIWTRSTEKSLRKASGENKEDTLSVNDKWEMFCNGTDKNASVFEVWQQFLNGSGSASDSSIPESEWLQTATSVLPSNDKEAKTWYAGRSQDCGFQVGLEPPTTSHAHISTSCHLLSDTCKTSLDNVALNTADRQPGQPCVGSPTDDNTGTRDASGRSETNSVTDTLQEFSPEGLPLVSKGDVESSTEWHKHEVWEIIEGVGGDKPFEPNTADLVTSSGELETTDVAATAECRNARAVDRISRMDELLSSSQERQETGTKNDMMDDRLAFKETVRQDTNIGERFVFLASRQGVEEAIMNNCMENKASTGEEIFRPQKTEECEISQRYADEKQRDEFRLNRNIEKPLRQDEVDEKEARPAQSQVVEFSANRSGDEDSERRQMTASKVKCEESGNVDVALNDKDVVAFKKTMALPSCSTTSKEMERVTDLQQWENSTIISGACNGQSRPIPTGEEIHNQTKEEESKAAPIQEDVQPESETGECQLREGNQRSCDGQTRPTMESREKIKVLLSGHEASGSFPSDECYTNTLEGIKMTCSHLHEDAKGQEEDPGHGISQEVTMKEDIDTTAELQRQPEILQETEEDLSQTDRDEKVSIRKLKIATPVESMGNPGFSWGASKNAEAQLKEQELPEVESSSHVECKRFSEGIKDPIRADETTALEGIESELGKTFVERFGDDLIKRVWKEVFNLKARASKRDLKTADLPQNMKESFPLEEDLSNISESCVFVLRGNSSLCQGLEQTLAAKSNEDSPRERGQSVVPAEQSHILSGLQRDSDSSAHFGQELASTGLHDQEKYTQVKERSVTHQEIRRQTEKHVVDPPDCLTYKPSSSEKLEESLCWSVLYILVHITRLVICILFVVGFFYIVYLCDFPAFFALYIFSLGWWFYKWKRHRGATNKSMAVD
ncbi:titin homolog isoform X2 [Antennarius striatus]